MDHRRVTVRIGFIFFDDKGLGSKVKTRKSSCMNARGIAHFKVCYNPKLCEQESSPRRIKYSICCPVPGYPLLGDTQPGWRGFQGYSPCLDLARSRWGYPIPGWGTPHLDLARVPPSGPGWGNPPIKGWMVLPPIQGWMGYAPPGWT